MKGFAAVRTLVAVQGKTLTNLSAVIEAARSDRKQLAKYIGIGAAILYVVVLMLFLYGLIFYPLMRAAATAGLAAPLLGLVLLGAMTVTMIFGIIHLIGYVFLARDVEFLFALPVSGRSVFASKFVVVYILEWLLAMLLFAPALVLYAWLAPVNWAIFLPAVLIVLPLLPAVPLALSALLASVFIRISVFSRRRDVFTIAGSIVMLAAVFYGQGRLQAYLGESSEETAAALLAGSEGMLRAATGAFPPAMWAAEALTQSATEAWRGLGWFAFVSLAALAFAVWFSGLLFRKAGSAHLEAAKTSTARAPKIPAARRPAALALFIRDWKILLRTPVYAINSLAGILIIPIMLVVMPNAGLADSLVYLDIPPDGWVLVFAALLTMLGVFNTAAATAVSREGRTFWLTRAIPLTARQQTLSRFAVSYAVFLLGLAAAVPSLYFALRPPAWQLLAALPIVLPLSAAVTAACMIPDALKPKLRWISESEAMKQNMNSLAGMLLGLVSGVPVWLAAFFIFNAGLDVTAMVALIALSAWVWAGFMLWILFRCGGKTAQHDV
jgi:ABC-2 type transport system permease protein